MKTKAHLVDAAFLMSDLGQGLAQDPDVIDPERGHPGRDRFRNNVGRVVRPADADLEYGRVDLLTGVGLSGFVSVRGHGIHRRIKELTRSCRNTCMAMMVKYRK